MNSIRKDLSKEYWAGKRWLAYDNSKGPGWLTRLRCFCDYSSAVAHCKTQKERNGVFRIRVLAEVLAGLNNFRPVEYTETERRILAELINNRPVSPYNYIPIEIGLCWHKYFPLLWNSVLHPLLIVKKYRVLARYHEAQYSKRFQIVDSFDDLDCALLAFMGIVRRSSLVDQKLVLVGQCNNEVSVPGSPKMLPENGNLVFYKSKAVWSAEGENWEPCIEQVHDPAQPIPTHTPLFACYNKYQGIIHFYDGGLKRIRPSNSAEPLDLSFFDFGRRGPFVNFEENGNR